MRYLLISFLFFSLSSCSLKTTKELLEVEVERGFVENVYFSDTSKDYVYKAKIDVYGNNFGGILIIKKLSKSKHRVVFTTEFGNRLFDFLFEENTVKKNFVVEEMDKKMIVNTLQKDFKLLINEENKILEQYVSDEYLVYKSSLDKRSNFYFINKKTHTLDKIVNATKTKEKVEIKFKNNDIEAINSIIISHKNIKLTIELERFKNE